MSWQTEVDYPINRITVGKRRRPLGDISSLASSIAQIGLLNRIHILPNGELVAGLHRLEACRKLGWQTIPVHILEVNDLDAELAEIDENLRRNELTVLEQAEHLQRREEILSAKGQRAPAHRPEQEKGETVSPLTTTAGIAAEIGLSERSAQQRLQIARNLDDEVKTVLAATPVADSTTQLLTLARLEPKEQRTIADRIAAGEAKDVKEAVRQLRHEERYQAAQQVAKAPDKIYNVIYADPPWEYRNTGVNGAATKHYPTMPLDELRALPDTLGLNIASNAVLFLWITNPLVAEAFDVIDAWGFTYKTNMVWAKTDLVRPGAGFYVRGRHELLFICTRGSFTPLAPNLSPPIGSVIEAPVHEHSRKPDLVYDIIERLYPGCSYIELFARRSRPGWDAWGNEI